VTETEAHAYLVAKYPGHQWSVFAPLGVGLPCMDKIMLYVPCPQLDADTLDAVAPQVIAMTNPRRI
jgi:hypothetical protein